MRTAYTYHTKLRVLLLPLLLFFRIFAFHKIVHFVVLFFSCVCVLASLIQRSSAHSHITHGNLNQLKSLHSSGSEAAALCHSTVCECVQPSKFERYKSNGQFDFPWKFPSTHTTSISVCHSRGFANGKNESFFKFICCCPFEQLQSIR